MKILRLYFLFVDLVFITQFLVIRNNETILTGYTVLVFGDSFLRSDPSIVRNVMDEY